MTHQFTVYWTRLVASNKPLGEDDSKITISVASFKKQLEKAFSEGRLSAQAESLKKDPISSIDDIFGSFMR